MARPIETELEYDPVVLGHCEAIAEEIVAEIRASPATPFLTGELLEGYRVSYDPIDDSYFVYSDVPYWRYVEFGTRHAHAQPHVRPAIDAVIARHEGLSQ